MKKTILICVLMLVVLAGCSAGSPVENFLGGTIVGLTAKVEEANVVMKAADENIDALKEKSDAVGEKTTELKVLLKDPIALANAIDPNLGAALNHFMVNAKSLAEKGKSVDWERLLMAIGLTAFTSGTGVKLYKDRKVTG